MKKETLAPIEPARVAIEIVADRKKPAEAGFFQAG